MPHPCGVRIRGGVVKAFVIVFLCIAIFGSAGFSCYRLFVAPQRNAKRESARPRPTMPPDPSIVEFEKCLKLKNAGKLDDARGALESFVDHNPNSPRIEEAKDALGGINAAIFLSTAPGPNKEQYVIQKGDTISAIERKTKTPSELIMRLNGIEDPTKLRIGETLIISHLEFSVKINRKTQVIALFNKGKFFKQYHVRSWNAPATRNPAAASGRVIEKVAWKDGHRVVFGTKEYAGSGRWISFSVPGFTLYTDEPDEGTPKPPGGLGMAAEEMKELSTLLNRSAPVTIE